MRSLICICLMLMAATMASAGSEKITTGPYDISFDLGTPLNYTVNVFSPLEDKNYTTYSVDIDVPNQTHSGIYIFEMKTPMDATMDVLTRITYWKQLYQLCAGEFLKANVKVGKVDGKDAMIAYALTNKSRQIYLCRYFLDGKGIDNVPVYAGSIDIQVVNILPADSSQGMAIADNLFRTIHIEKTNISTASKIPTASKAAEPVSHTSNYNQKIDGQNVEALMDEVISNGFGWK